LPEATTGFEPVIAVLQTAAFPLGYVALFVTLSQATGRIDVYEDPSPHPE
jgi:hypothetical protein